MTSHDPITPRARDLFERASAGLDHGMAFRLRRARLEAQQAPARRRPGAVLVPAGAFAAAVLALGVAWWLPPGGEYAPANDVASTSEIDALVIEEDADLYAWLADAPVATTLAGPRL